MLTREGYLINSPGTAARAKRELTATALDASGIGYPKRVKAYRESNGFVIAPRFWAQDVVGPPLTTHFGDIARISAPFEGQLREDLDQVAAVAAVEAALQTTGGAVLSLGTGQGKTTCACALIGSLGVKTVVLVHKDVLRTQWAERLNQFLPQASVSFVQGGTVDLSGDVVIAMIQTLVSKNVAFPGVGLVVVDECHHIGAEVFSTALRTLCTPYSLGLSATPQRKDGLTKIVHWYLGKLAYYSTRRAPTDVVVDLIRYDCPAYRQQAPQTRFGTVDFPGVMTDLVDNRLRTAKIVDLIATLRAKDPTRCILVLSHRRDHCAELAKSIPEAATLVGSQGKKKRKADDSHTTAPVVVATFAMASEGYDDPRLDTLVLATPCSDVVQAAGRVLRGSSTTQRRIIDIVDEWGPLWAMASKRQAYYRKAGFKMNRVRPPPPAFLHM